jgi:tRNA A-37 threonylcarbamoyl transferase component Bud32
MLKEIRREKLPSKKNHVYRESGLNQDVVVKMFTAAHRFNTEKEIGELLEDSNLTFPPRVAVDDENLTIIYSYINGYPVVDLIEDIEMSEAQDIIRKICAWLLEFYAVIRQKKGCQYILGDIHLRNFLYEKASHQVYGLDFEECRPGRIETDAARLYVFILYYEPAFTARKKDLTACLWQTLAEALVLDEELFQQEVERETQELLARRRHKRPALN